MFFATAALKECWKHRLQVLKKDLGYDGAPMLEQLLIQQAALCWLKLNLLELSYSGTMKQSITLTLGMYWEKRLSAAQRRFTPVCETLARVRKLSRNTPALQFNIATGGMAASEPHESKQSKRTLSLRFTMPSSFNPTICVLPH